MLHKIIRTFTQLKLKLLCHLKENTIWDLEKKGYYNTGMLKINILGKNRIVSFINLSNEA